MTLADFIAAHQGQFVYTENKPPTPAQCVDLANLWCDVLGIERFPGNAADFQFDSHPDCDWVANTPTNIPLPGDIVVWAASAALGFGHVAIFDVGDTLQFASFDENWPLNSPAHVQRHSYVGVAGWLHPRVSAGLPQVVPMPPVDPEDLARRVADLERLRASDLGFIDALVAEVADLQKAVTAIEAGLGHPA